MWTKKYNLVWKHPHVFLGHHILISLTPRDLHLLFYEWIRFLKLGGALYRKHKLVLDVTCVFLFIPWLAFNKQTEKSDSCFLSIYAQNIFQDAKAVTKSMSEVGFFLYYFRWFFPHVIGEYQHTSVSKFKHFIGKSCITKFHFGEEHWKCILP